MSDRLEQLLRHVDAAAPPPRGDELMGERIRRRLAHERRVRSGGMAGALALGAIVVWVIAARHGVSNQRIAKSATALPQVDPRVELARLNLEAELHEKTAQALIADRSAKPQTAIVVAPATPDMRVERDRAALILVYDADRFVKAKEPADAIALYRRAIELFPKTHWADVARQRLKDLET